jgi:fructokinase
MVEPLLAGIEAGGTKVICAVARADGTVLAQTRVLTRAPDETFGDMARFFEHQSQQLGPVSAGGVASFGPLDLDRTSAGYGRLTSTPKQGWSDVDILGHVQAMLGAPVTIDTDVNCAGQAEARYGAARGLDRLCYITVGTGIGVGVVEDGRTNTGAGHPEVGHIRIPRAADDDFAGICPSHGDCAEGLASGPAMKRRWHASAEELAADHVGWVYEAQYIAALCVNLTYIVRPQRIIIGGGVMERSSLMAAVRGSFASQMAGYALDRYSGASAIFLAAPELHDPSPGLVGAIDLARDLLVGRRWHG